MDRSSGTGYQQHCKALQNFSDNTLEPQVILFADLMMHSYTAEMKKSCSIIKNITCNLDRNKE